MTTRVRLHLGVSTQCHVAAFTLLSRKRKQLLTTSLRLTGLDAGTFMEANPNLKNLYNHEIQNKANQPPLVKRLNPPAEWAREWSAAMEMLMGDGHESESSAQSFMFVNRT